MQQNSFWVQATDADQDDSPFLYREFQGAFLPPAGSLFFIDGKMTQVRDVATWNAKAETEAHYAVYVEANSSVFAQLQTNSSWSAEKPSFMET